MFGDVIKREDEGYRRGVVLGLTMAEVTILMLFCLLLTTVLLLNMKQRKVAELQVVLNGAAYVVAPDVLQQMETKYGPINSQSKIDEDFQKLFAAAKAEDALRKASVTPDSSGSYASVVGDLADQAKTARDAVSASGQPDKTPGDIKQGMTNIQKAVVDLAAKGAFRNGATATPDSVKTAMAGNLCALQYNSPPQLAECEKKVIEIVGGKGLQFQSCWWDKTTVPWKTRNLYEVALTDEGYVVRDVDPEVPEYRAQKSSELGLRTLALNAPISSESFLSQTNAVYKWSVDHQCRFYVRVFDETGPASKEIFKNRLEALEGHFYKEMTRRRFFGSGTN